MSLYAIIWATKDNEHSSTVFFRIKICVTAADARHRYGYLVGKNISDEVDPEDLRGSYRSSEDNGSDYRWDRWWIEKLEPGESFGLDEDMAEPSYDCGDDFCIDRYDWERA